MIKCPPMSVLRYFYGVESYHGRIIKSGEPLKHKGFEGFFFTQRWLTYMPMKPKKPCKHLGCPGLTGDQYCELHAKLHTGDRSSAFERGYSHRWQMARKQFLANHHLCVECESAGIITLATVVDHIRPHRGDEVLFWDENNWQPLCKKCHDRKTRTRDQHKSYTY